MTDDAEPREIFDALMADLDQPMVVATTASGSERAGCLVGFHAQSSIDPATYAVWLSKANHTYRLGATAEYYAVHLLTPAERDIAELFGGQSQDDIDKFEACEWSAGPDGVPLLDRVQDRFVGRRQAWLDPGGDHICVVLHPVSATRSGAARFLRLSDVTDLEPGHEADERPEPNRGRRATGQSPS